MAQKQHMPKELVELLEWFDNYEVTFNEVKLSECEYIRDLKKFISVQSGAARQNWENPTFRSDIRSLFRLRKVLENRKE